MNGCLDIENQALTKDGYFRKDLSFCIFKNSNEYQKSWMFRWMFRNLGFFVTQVFMFDYRPISKRRMFANLRFFVIQVFVFDYS